MQFDVYNGSHVPISGVLLSATLTAQGVAAPLAVGSLAYRFPNPLQPGVQQKVNFFLGNSGIDLAQRLADVYNVDLAIKVTNIDQADGKRLMLSQGPVVIADAATGKDLFRSTVDYFSGSALSPDGRIVCEAPDQEGMIVLRDAQTAKEVRRLKGPPRTLSACVLSPDGIYLAAAFHSEPRTVVLWEVATGKKLWEVRAEGEGEGEGEGTPASTVMVLAFSPDSRILASGSYGGTVRLWEVATGRERRVFRGHQGSVVALRFSPDGRRLISGGADAVGMVWDVLGVMR